MGSARFDLRSSAVEQTATTPPGESLIGRRELLGGAMLAAIAGLAKETKAAAMEASPLERKLVERCTFGANAEELARVDQLGYDGYLEYQLDHLSIDDSELEARIATYVSLFETPAKTYTYPNGYNDLTDATILRAILSKRQLFERAVDFWNDHFSMYVLDGDVRYLKIIDDREVIRPNALGSFSTLLRASAHSPSMLLYLDNNTNVRTGPNENYARELLELHTLGVSGGYAQADVQEVARCLTGWTYYTSPTSPLRGQFRFNSTTHDTGAKTVLGHQIAAGGGISDGETVLNILLAHPSTARFIATKMVAYFWGPYAPQSLIDSVAAVFTATNGSIKDMLRTILSQASLQQAPPKFKRPLHLVSSMLRVVQPTITSVVALRGTHLGGAGHVPFRWLSPDGYPDSEDYWSGLIMARWNFAFSLMSGQISGISPSNAYLTGGATTAAAIAERIDQLVYAGTMPLKLKSLITEYMLPNPPTAIRVRDAWALAMAAPNFQYF